jgi:hypothetical protein
MMMVVVGLTPGIVPLQSAGISLECRAAPNE